MMNNVVSMFSRPMKRQLTSRESIVRSYGSVGSRAIDIVHKFLERFPAWTKPERVLMGLL